MTSVPNRVLPRAEQVKFGNMRNELSPGPWEIPPEKKWNQLPLSVTQKQEMYEPVLKEGGTGVLRNWEVIGP